MLQRIQNNCLKICANKPKRYGTDRLHQELKIPLLLNRREAHLRNFAYKRTKHAINLQVKVRETRANQAPLLKAYKPISKSWLNSVSSKTAQCWNRLPMEIRNIVDDKKFKKRTKMDLLKLY